jgi:hypothetical protein
MKLKRLCGLALAMPMLAAAVPTPAPGAQPPTGSYRASCSNVVVRGTTLEASCRNARGWPERASLADYGQCRGDIQNNDGRLQCVVLPPGSYRLTCKDNIVDGAVLKAVCEDERGRWVSTSLARFDRCRTISNDNGKLVCGGSSGSRIPSGSFAATCRDIAVAGDTLRASCETVRGSWVPASLPNYRRCAGDIRNSNGRLEC